MRNIWLVWIDTGGTFTDCIARDPAGHVHRAKVLSSGALRARVASVAGPASLTLAESWALPRGFLIGARLRMLDAPDDDFEVVAYAGENGQLEVAKPFARPVPPGTRCELHAGCEAPVIAAHLVSRTPLSDSLPAMSMRLATTRGTNALLERRGAPTVLFITHGFGDLLAIGTQQRPDLFALDVRKPRPLYDAAVEVPERLEADGSVLEPLDIDRVAGRVSRLAGDGFRCAAVALMHSYRNPDHEHQLARYVASVGFEHVSCSADLAPFIGLLARSQTAVVDAYLAPVVGGYLQSVSNSLDRGSLHVMTSAGGLVAAPEFKAKDALLSGPAGGVVGAARAGRSSGFSRLISFDMGGTSTDVARWDGDFEYMYEHRVGDAHLVAPALAIESVAAGGGSVCRFSASRPRVGPESAGAMPGPACYGEGGPLTLTDVNLLLGRVAADQFEIPIDRAASEHALATATASVDWGGDGPPTREQILEGFLQIANERMASAIRRISVRSGYDPREYALVAFGGAGPQHACAVADLLEMRTVVVPENASLLSASGLGHALVERFAHQQLLQLLDDASADIPSRLAELAVVAREQVVSEGIDPSEVVVRRNLMHLRLLGQDATLEVEWRRGISPAQAFADRYRLVYGYEPPPQPVEVESLRVIASTRPGVVAVASEPTILQQPPRGRLFVPGPYHRVPVFDRRDLPPGAVLAGPALILERHSATVVASGWELGVDGARSLVLTSKEAGDAA